MGYKKIITFFIIILSIIIFHKITYAEVVPGSEEVRTELRKIVGQTTKSSSKSKPGDVKKDFKFNLDWLLNFFKRSGSIFNIILILIIAALIVIVVLKFYPYLKSGSYQIDDNPQINSVRKISPANQYYKNSLEFYKKGDYRKSAIFLHKGTIEYLIREMLIARNSQYTNNQVKRMIGVKNKIYTPFCSISRTAEVAAFSLKDVDENDCRKNLEIFKKIFAGIQ